MKDGHHGQSGAAGFTLVEAVVATTILAVTLTSLAQLFLMSVRATARSKETTFAVLLAQQKMEQLRGLTFGFGLAPSPPGALRANTSGYCDFVDRVGVSLGGGTRPPPNTTYIRRWSVEPLPANPAGTLVMQVLVTPHRDRGDADVRSQPTRLPGEARIVSVRTRKAG